MNFGIIFNKKGQIAILIVLLLLAVILAVSVGLITLTLRGMKMARNVTESVRAFAAADAGMEYILKKRADGEVPSANLCTDNVIIWKEVLDESGQESYYCVGSVVLTEGKDGYYSIGRSGDVRRSIFAPAPGSLDQSSLIIGDNTGHAVCTCKDGDFGPINLITNTFQSAQTFIAGRDGVLFAASAYILVKPKAGNINLRAEIRDVDAAYIDNFYPAAAKPGTTVLASTTDFILGNERTDKCVPIGQSTCRYIAFKFDPPATTTEGGRYTFLIEGVGTVADRVEWAVCCGERRYLPGKGWHRPSNNEAVAWQDTYVIGANQYRFDYDFKVYILTDPTGEFEESFP